MPYVRKHPHDNFRMRRRAEFVAKGSSSGKTMRQTTIVLDDETFEEIIARAKKQRISYCAEVRELIEMGLETLKLEGAW